MSIEMKTAIEKYQPSAEKQCLVPLDCASAECPELPRRKFGRMVILQAASSHIGVVGNVFKVFCNISNTVGIHDTCLALNGALNSLFSSVNLQGEGGT